MYETRSESRGCVRRLKTTQSSEVMVPLSPGLKCHLTSLLCILYFILALSLNIEFYELKL